MFTIIIIIVIIIVIIILTVMAGRPPESPKGRPADARARTPSLRRR